MNITIGKPFGISDIGRRYNNEDAIFPLSEQAKYSDRLFLVCDGVGGSEKGEIASALACESIQVYFNTFKENEGTAPTEAFIKKAIQYAETRFDSYINEHPAAHGMATTMTLLYIADSSVTIAHVGDSRIYHFRKGEILHKTEDHSLINLWLRMGRLTPEEAAVHPQRNVITQAIMGTEKPAHPEVAQTFDILPGDFLFLCTDGVLESFDDNRLASLFNGRLGTEHIKDSIIETCLSQSKDNYSFYIVPIIGITDSANYKQIITSIFYSLI